MRLSKARKLREMFQQDQVIRCIGAHNGLSARLAEEAGSDAIWASGLEVSTAHAVPDANILTMTDYLREASAMNDAVEIPVVADCDTGYGNVNNVIHMVRKYEAAGIAAVCIEDKRFPKVNSFVPGRQDLAPIAEFVGKIRAAKNAQQGEDFQVFSRVEALIAGWGQDEAMRRAIAYAEAGADAILIHSKQPQPDEILEFIESYSLPIPLIIVPTTYPTLDIKATQALNKVRMVIYANHGLRTAITHVSQTFREILNTGSTLSVEPKIAPLKQVFQLQGMPDLKAAEKEYGYSGRDPIKVLIPAAGTALDPGLREVLGEAPVASLDINGKPLLQRQVELLNNTNIQDIRAVIAEGAELQVGGVELLPKPKAAQSHILGTVAEGLRSLSLRPEERLLLLYSDILFDRQILKALVDCKGEITLVVDRAGTQRDKETVDLVQTSLHPAPDGRLLAPEGRIFVHKIGASVQLEEATHEFIGMALFSKPAVEALQAIASEAPDDADLTYAITRLIEKGLSVDALEVERGWSELHTPEDQERICAQLLGASR